MKKAAKKRGKGRPRKADCMKAIVISASVTPDENKILKRLMKKMKVGQSKAIKWLLNWWAVNEE